MGDPSSTEGRPRQPIKIEFIGGPFDGYRDCRRECAEHLPQELIWFVSLNAFRLIEGLEFGPHSPITSVALYERDEDAEDFRYRFVGAIAVHELSPFKSGK